MAYTYTYPPNAVLETGKPARAVDIRAIRDIGPAIAEGAAGAPKNLGKSMDIDIGNLTGTTAIVDLQDAAKVLLTGCAIGASTGGAAAARFGYRLSSDNGATWDAEVVLARASLLGSGGGAEIVACAAGARIIDMTGANAIRLSGSGTLSGALIWVEGA